MILRARRSLAAKVARHQAPQIDIFFLNIRVRRSHLISDSLNEVTIIILNSCFHFFKVHANFHTFKCNQKGTKKPKI